MNQERITPPESARARGAHDADILESLRLSSYSVRKNNDVDGGLTCHLNILIRRCHLPLYQLLQLLLWKVSSSRCRRSCCWKASCTISDDDRTTTTIWTRCGTTTIARVARHPASSAPVPACSVHAENCAGLRH